jgi:hypothetical protein
MGTSGSASFHRAKKFRKLIGRARCRPRALLRPARGRHKRGDRSGPTWLRGVQNLLKLRCGFRPVFQPRVTATWAGLLDTVLTQGARESICGKPSRRFKMYSFRAYCDSGDNLVSHALKGPLAVAHFKCEAILAWATEWLSRYARIARCFSGQPSMPSYGTTRLRVGWQ